MKIYAIYKGENFLFEGTSKECAKHFGVNPTTVYHWNIPINKKKAGSKRKNGKNRQRKIAIVIEEEKDVNFKNNYEK